MGDFKAKLIDVIYFEIPRPTAPETGGHSPWNGLLAIFA
jgi:hypothetical protein